MMETNSTDEEKFPPKPLSLRAEKRKSPPKEYIGKLHYGFQKLKMSYQDLKRFLNLRFDNLRFVLTIRTIRLIISYCQNQHNFNSLQKILIISRFCQKILPRSRPKLSWFVPFPPAKAFRKVYRLIFQSRSGSILSFSGVYMLYFPNFHRHSASYLQLQTSACCLPLPVQISVSFLPHLHSAIQNSSRSALCCRPQYIGQWFNFGERFFFF